MIARRDLEPLSTELGQLSDLIDALDVLLDHAEFSQLPHQRAVATGIGGVVNAVRIQMTTTQEELRALFARAPGPFCAWDGCSKRPGRTAEIPPED